MKTVYQNENNEKKNSTEKNLEKDINNIKLNRMEDDIKNIINEKDEIIKNMNDKLLRQEKIINYQSEQIKKLWEMMNNMNTLNDKLNRSTYFDIEILGTDKEIKDLKGVGLDVEIFDEKSFDNYFNIENQLESNKFIFSINQKKNDKIPIKELISKFVSLFLNYNSNLYEKYKEKGVQYKIRENNKGRISIDFYVDKKFLYDLNGLNYDDKYKLYVGDKGNIDNENTDKDKDGDIFKIILNKLKFSKIYDKSDFNFYFKMCLRTDFLFKYLFEEDIETIIKNRLNFKLMANTDINTKIFILSILDILIEEENEREDNYKINLLKSIKLILSTPIKKIKYDLIENNKKEIYDFIIKLYKKFEQNIQEWKKIYNSEDWIEELYKGDRDSDSILRDIFKLLYELIDVNELDLAFGFINNKLGFQIKTKFPEDNKINFFFILFPLALLIIGLINLFYILNI